MNFDLLDGITIMTAFLGSFAGGWIGLNIGVDFIFIFVLMIGGLLIGAGLGAYVITRRYGYQ